MLFNEPSTRNSLRRMIRGLTGNEAFHEDLLQEALIHLWTMEIARSGQTRSWYWQSCQYHLQHNLAGGRSVDSAKRRDGRVPLTANGDGMGWFEDDADSGNSVFDVVSARDIISVLSARLDRQERAVLECFADGLRLREIGRKLKVSHTMVIRHRRKIASLLKRLEQPSVPRKAVAAPVAGSIPAVGAHAYRVRRCGESLQD